MAAYLFGDAWVGFMVAIALATAIGLGFSALFAWTSNKNAIWNIGFAIAVAVIGTASALAAILFVLRRLVSLQ